jgi:hypothetical protein
MTPQKLTIVSLIPLLLSCSKLDHQQVPRACDYKSIAERAINAQFPEYHSKRSMAVQDHGDFVTVNYPVQKGWVGGSPEVEIYKSECKIKRVHLTQ